MIASPLSREFALNVANWRLISREDGDGFSWELWHDENGKMVNPPNFAESVDALMPYVSKFMNIAGGASDGWSVNFLLNDRNDVASGNGASLSEALAKALLDEEKQNRY
jgi:hypothetical protein